MKHQKLRWFTDSSSRFVCALSLLALSLCASASPESNQKVFRFNISPNGYPPYMIVGQNEPSGIMWDVVALISGRLGYQIVAKQVPRKRVDQMLLDGYIDGTSRAEEWTHQPEKFLFTEPVVEVQEVFFTPKDAGKTYHSPEDLFSKTLVTHLGYMYPALEPHFESGAIKRFDVSRERDMFIFLLHGDRFDAAVVNLLVGKWILKNEGLQGRFTISSGGISSYGFRVMLRKESQAFADKFNAELARIRENGELNAILANYR
ncbi:MAG: transporter substrate-binding domain-containing protein [Oceanospirillales bacterium]|jgi:polar amino acid transport system substrate-binding protein|uniref:substrate-binding periplasmic protein n=1 Tax=Marinobacter maritimus TaxID=277961 RepID=UPI000BD23B72|nr:transporter substrate-binding domain-containing protein [Marinobacter maritimus]MBL1271629.1 transporter substrate-binding domain-containing protein [Oceanospirillales bacterium]